MKKFACVGLFFFVALIPTPRFGSATSTLAFNGSNSYFVVDAPITSFSGTLNLPDESVGRIIGPGVIFSNGQVQIGSKSSYSLTGTYSPQTQAPITVPNGSTIVLPSGTVNTAIVVNSGTTATLVGSPNFTKPISLQDSTSVLKLGLQSQISQNIELNGGTIILDDNLSLQAGKQFIGNGTIDVNGRTLKLPKGTASTGKLTFLAANDIALSGNLIDSTEYSFTGTGKSSEINGGGYTWTFSPGGLISVGPDHKLYCVNLSFQEFGHQPTHGYFDIDATSTVIFQGCSISMTGSYTHSKGTLEFASDCNVTPHGHTFGTTGLAFIKVNGANLIYDSLGDADKNPFTFTNINSQQVLANNGAIKSNSSAPNLTLTGTTLTFNSDYNLAANSFMLFQNATPLVTKNITTDFNGHTVTFPKISTAVLKLDPKVNLTFSNVVLFDFNKNSISYGDSNANLFFGAGTKIRLFETENITASDKAWTFTGNSTVSGSGAALILDGATRIVVSASTTLTLQDLKITAKNANSLSMNSPTAKIILQNCDLILGSNGLDFSQGNIEIKGNLRVFGGDATNFDSDSKLTFSSSGTFTVLTDSLLKLGKHVEFEYKPNPSTDGGVTFNSKRHFILASATATLELDGGTLHSTLTGLALDYGRLIVSDRSFFKIDGSNGREAEIGSALEIFIRPSTTLVVTGTLAYSQTTLP